MRWGASVEGGGGRAVWFLREAWRGRGRPQHLLRVAKTARVVASPLPKRKKPRNDESKKKGRRKASRRDVKAHASIFLSVSQRLKGEIVQ